MVAASSVAMVSEAAGDGLAQAQEEFLDNTSVRTALSSTVPGSIAGHNASFVKSFADAYEQINSVAEAIEQTGGDTSAVRPTPPPTFRPRARTLALVLEVSDVDVSPPLAFERLGKNLGTPPPRPHPDLPLRFPPPSRVLAQLKTKLDELVALHEAHAGRDARLRAYAREYRCTVGPTDFAGVVRDAEPVPVPDDHAHPARRFSEAVDHARRERTGADATPQDEDGDVVDVTQAAAGGARATAP